MAGEGREGVKGQANTDQGFISKKRDQGEKMKAFFHALSMGGGPLLTVGPLECYQLL